jgi:Phosphate-selective porin O and P
MVRVLAGALALSGVAIALPAQAVDIGAGHTAVMAAEISYVDLSALPPWTNGSVGKLRYDSDAAVLSRLYLDYEGHLGDTVTANVALEGYDDELGNALDITQAYLEWRPVPQSRNRYRLRVGAFYPRISLENRDAGWSSPYTLNLSAINTWVAEELRSIGAELSLSRQPARLGGLHEFTLHAAVFTGNDPAGSLLAWKGWSVHDRQSRFGDELPLPPLPQIQPGMMFEKQDPYVTPFREVDGSAGYSVGGGWRYRTFVELQFLHFDNRADPTALVSGQYGWRTRFDSIGLQASLPREIGLIGQWLRGSTVMGPVVSGAHVVDTGFDSFFLLLTRAFGKHRLSVRYDNFTVSDNDATPQDDNADDGHAWTLSYRYAYSGHLGIGVEWLDIETRHPAWAYYGLPQAATERQLQATVTLQF